MNEPKINFTGKKSQSPKNLKETSWENSAVWYDNLLEESEGTYQKDLILPNLMRLLDLKKGERVLDLACGQGFFSREFLKTGAEVFGVDLSKSLIEIAKERSPKEIQYTVSSASDLKFMGDRTIDAVALVLAIQNINNPAEVFAEIFRVLKIGGRFVVVINHPAFRIPKKTAWGFDDEKKIQYRRVDEYISESRSEIVMNPGLGRTNLSDKFVFDTTSSVSTISFHRPLQFYFKAFRKAGFLVSRLEEWVSSKKSEPGPRADAENRARKEFPMFMAIEVKKLKV